MTLSKHAAHAWRKTLLLDSTYRDRCLYPNPSDYVVPYQNVLGTNTTHNPVTAAYPIYAWQWNNTTTSFTGTIVAGSPIKPTVANTTAFQALTEIARTTNASATTPDAAQDMFRNLVMQVSGTTYNITAFDAFTQTFTLEKDITNFTVGQPYTLINGSTASQLVLQGFNFTYLGEGSNDSGNSVTAQTPLWTWDLSTAAFEAASLQDHNLVLQTPLQPWNASDVQMVFSDVPPLVTGTLQPLGYLLSASANVLVCATRSSSVGPITTTTVTIPVQQWTADTLTAFLNATLGVATVTLNLQTAIVAFAPTTPFFQISSASTCLAYLGFPPTDTWSTGVVQSTVPLPWAQVANFFGPASIAEWSLLVQQPNATPWSSQEVLVAVDANGAGDATFLATEAGTGVVLTCPGTAYKPSATYFLVPLSQTGTALTAEQQSMAAQILVKSTLPVLCLDTPETIPMTRPPFLFLPVWSALFATQRLCVDTGATQAGLFTNVVNAFPPPAPTGNTTLPASLAHYGVQIIAHSFNGFPTGSSAQGAPCLYVQLRQLDAALAARLVALSTCLYRGGAFTTAAQRAAVLPNSGDSTASLNEPISAVSMSQMNCYTLHVSSLILPNQPIDQPFGALTSSYPYVYVQIANESAASAHNRHTLFSNNPNATFATFLLPISDVNNPTTTKFIKLFSSESQHVKFRPNDALRFRVFLPDGTTLINTLRDNLPPLRPNPLLQITLVLEMSLVT